MRTFLIASAALLIGFLVGHYDKRISVENSPCKVAAIISPDEMSPSYQAVLSFPNGQKTFVDVSPYLVEIWLRGQRSVERDEPAPVKGSR